MDEVNIFIIGVLVSVLSLIGVVYTVLEFRKMTEKGGQSTERKDSVNLDSGD